MTLIPTTTAQTKRRELLKGGAKITEHVIKRKAKRKDIRWLYGQLAAFAGVIWRLKEDGELLSWTDELDEFLETRAAEAKADALAAAEAKAAEKEALLKAAAKSVQPAPARSRKPPAREAVAARKAPAKPHRPAKAKTVAAE